MNKRKIQPKAGQESVWDYPRPPRLEEVNGSIRIEHAGQVIAEAQHAYRILETSHPPVYYIAPSDIRMQFLHPNPRPASFCEFKGAAQYWDLAIADQIINEVGWSYPRPTAKYTYIRNHIAFYASKLDACFLNDEKVKSQAGDFYGGWITSSIVGPFKGGPGTWGW